MLFRVFAVLVSLSGSLLTARDGTLPNLDTAVKQKVAGFQGKVSLYAENLKTGKRYSLLGEQPVRTASTIKLAIMTECFAEAHEGKLNLGEMITLTGAEKVSGSGILQELSNNDQLPIRDMIDLMIVLSDNTATNLILNRIGGDAVNARMQSLGLTYTRVMRKIMGDGRPGVSSGITEEGKKPENKKWGLGRSSPLEMVTLLRKIYRGELVSKSASDEMLAILKHQRDRNGLGRDMKDVEVADKTGALEHLRSDVGIIYSADGPIAMAVTVDDMPQSDWTPDNPGELLISQLSEIVTKGLSAEQAH
ncbi:MAG TPA: serine hydrolase [Bryobacteraceae bacterium]|nr:serine hydrolase [Bryobacteraceae bacterium]